MKKTVIIICLVLLYGSSLKVKAQETLLDSIIPVRGFSISAPTPEYFDQFLKFVDEELAPRKVNVLLLLIGYRYEFEKHPELRDTLALTKEQVKSLVRLCKSKNIQLIPQLQILGHQSSMTKANMLLQKYPEFDETPHVKILKEREWPNEQELYAKSYCPLHPGVHKVVYDCVDELMEVFEADAFHAGMDEIFYIADELCPRCSGRDKAELFAGEVTKLYYHLEGKGEQLWIWGDRLIDGKITGLGMWDASMNNTARAIDLIPKEVVICDWHYRIAVPSSVYFAMKGFNVVTCPHQKTEVALTQLQHFVSFRENSPKIMADRFQGMMETIWIGADNFLEVFYNNKEEPSRQKGAAETFRILFDEINKLE